MTKNNFGILGFNDLSNHTDANKYMRRGIIFGHRGYDLIEDAIKFNKPFNVVGGFMPSGPAHFGHKMVMEEIIWYQKHGGTVFITIADIEANSVRGISLQECRDIGTEYILNLITLGLKIEKSYIYFQSDNLYAKNLVFKLNTKINLSELNAIYGFSGETNISHMISPILQSADILYTQLKEFGGPKPTIVPVGIDQDPHIRLTRELVNRMNMFYVFEENNIIKVYPKAISKDIFESLINHLSNKDIKVFDGHININDNFKNISNIVKDFELSLGGYAFISPSSIYHKFMMGLQNGKMSSSKPNNTISLTEDPKKAIKKIMSAKTGGRVTLNEQKKFGGICTECVIFDLMKYHLIENDTEISNIEYKCSNGKLTCGDCKKRVAILIEDFLINNKEKIEEI